MPHPPPPPRAKGAPKTGGRRKGQPNHATIEVKQFSRRVLTDPQYARQVLQRMRSMEPPPHLETLLYHYAFGRPAQTLEVSGTFDHALYLASKTPDKEE